MPYCPISQEKDFGQFIAGVICGLLWKPCVTDLTVEFFEVSAYLIFFKTEFDVTWIANQDLRTELWTIIAQNFSKLILKCDGFTNKASNSHCIGSRLIYYNLPGIYYFKANNAGWEVYDLHEIISSYTSTPFCVKIFLWKHILQWNR